MCICTHGNRSRNKAVEKERLLGPTRLGPGKLTGNERMTDIEEMTGTHADWMNSAHPDRGHLSDYSLFGQGGGLPRFL